MGVQHLWNILEQSKSVESVEKLRDKTLCIDLSIWICEAQGTKGLKDQLKPYLRNVFFRTMYLVSIGVRPVFVIDGIPPELKRETILKRLDARCVQSGKRKNVSDKQRKLKRSKFSIWCNECCEMFRLLGIPFVKSEGEAEAMCALLNINQYVDGVLTDDGDVFLYGAQVVYKDFNISSSKLLTDCLQVYRMKNIESQLGLNRRNMIALALLLGCDYVPSGVPGIGKETAVKLLSSLSGLDLLDRFREWKASPDVHPEHYTSLEVAVKRKAVKVPDFPNKEVVKEFLSPNVGKKNFSIKWTCPDLEGIKEFFSRKLDWPKDYTEEKMLNLATDWQLAYCNPYLKSLFVPVRIVKQRMKQKVQHYEVEWKTQDSQSKWPTTFVSIKLKDVMLEKHSIIVESFEREIIAKKSKNKTKKKDLKSKAVTPTLGDELLESLAAKVDNMSIKDVQSLPSEEDKEYEVTTQTGESATNTKPGRELPDYSLIDDMAINSNALDELPVGGAHLKLRSFPVLFPDNNLNFSSQHPGALNTHQPITCDLQENTTMVELKNGLKPLHTLGVVSRRTKNETCDDNKKENYWEAVIVDLPCSEQGVKLINLECAGSSKVSAVAGSGDPHLVEHGHDKIWNCLESPASNEKTPLNLVEITIDSSFGSDLGTMEDLLASSFVAQLKDKSYGDQLPGVCDYHERFRSPRPEVSDYVIPRCSENLSQRLTNEINPDHDNDSYLDNFERLDLPSLHEFTSSKNELQSYKGRRNDDVDCNGSNNTQQAAKNGSCVFRSSTPQFVEESSLTSRLLKRFRGKDGGIENTLLLISSDGDAKEHKACAQGKEKSSKPVKPVKTYSRPHVASDGSRPLNNITNQIKKTDIAVVVLD